MTGSPIIVRATCTPILIRDPPLLNVVGMHQPFTPRAVIELETDTGVTGIGETYGDTDYLRIAQVVSDKIVGRPLTAINTLYDLVRDWAQVGSSQQRETDFDGLRGSGSDEKLIRSVFSAFEVACLDALGKGSGSAGTRPARWQVRDASTTAHTSSTGGPNTPARASRDRRSPVDDWGAAVDPAGVVAQAQRFIEHVRLQLVQAQGRRLPARGGDRRHQGARARRSPAARCGWTPTAPGRSRPSLQVARELGGILEYLEDPTPRLAEMAEVAPGTGVPLATNMCVTTFAEIPEAFAANAVQVVLSDHHYWGGLHATRELAAICRTFGVALSMHSNTHLGISLAAMTHVASVIPDLDHACDTHRPWQTEDVITEPHLRRRRPRGHRRARPRRRPRPSELARLAPAVGGR